MAPVRLPVAPAAMTITEALGVVAREGGGGVLASDGGDGTVMTTADLLEALRSGGDGAVGKVAGAAHVVSGKITVSEPAKPGAKTRTALVGDLPAGLAAGLRTSVTLWQCVEDHTHIWTSDELVEPGKCNLDGAALDPL